MNPIFLFCFQNANFLVFSLWLHVNVACTIAILIMLDAAASPNTTTKDILFYVSDAHFFEFANRLFKELIFRS